MLIVDWLAEWQIRRIKNMKDLNYLNLLILLLWFIIECKIRADVVKLCPLIKLLSMLSMFPKF